MHRATDWSAVVLLSFLLSSCAAPQVKRPFQNFKDLRDQNVVKQGFDYSCATGALATLLTYYFDDPVQETELLVEILETLPEEVITNRKKEGLSLLDLKKAGQRRGYQVFGVQLTCAALTKLSAPILVYLEDEDLKHFAILKGVRADRVFLADPSRGNLRMSVARFCPLWKGKFALLISKPGFEPTENLLRVEQTQPLRPELAAMRRRLFP